MNQPKINTLGELKKTDYKFLSIKDELRENLITKLKNTNIDNYKELAKKHKCRIFNFTENIFKC